MNCLVSLYVGGLLVNVLNLRSAGTLSVGTVAQAVIWPVSAVGQLYAIVAPAVVAVIGYITALINKVRGK
jgi:uncharacterized membrane protein YccC